MPADDSHSGPAAGDDVDGFREPMPADDSHGGPAPGKGAGWLRGTTTPKDDPQTGPATGEGAGGLHEGPATAWRTLGLFFLGGGFIGALSLVLPHSEAFDETGLWTNVALTVAVAPLCFVAPRFLPPWSVHLALAAGTLTISRAVYLSDDSGFYAIFYVWVGLYAFFFFGRRWGVLHMAFAGLAYAWLLTELPGTDQVARWVMTIGTLAVGGILIDARARRLRDLAARFATLAEERAGLLTTLEHVARTDDLTGLPNRRAWNEELEREVARARRESTPLCVGVIDLDRFKEFNDRHGHQAGDRLLKSLAGAWRQRLRTTDVLARYGGEEFVLALPGCDVRDACELIERMREVVPDEQTCSAGIAEWDGKERPAAVFARADAALYEAKAAGRDRIATA